MYQGYDKEADALHLDPSSNDWRLGMVENMARLLITRGVAAGVEIGTYMFRGFTPGSLAEHFYANARERHTSLWFQGTGDCTIISVTHLEEFNYEEYEHDTFNGPTARKVEGIAGTVTCEHGCTGRMKYAVSLGELIYEIASL